MHRNDPPPDSGRGGGVTLHYFSVLSPFVDLQESRREARPGVSGELLPYRALHAGVKAYCPLANSFKLCFQCLE